MIIHVVACNQDGIIGKSGPESLLWSIPEDMRLFSNLTKGAVVVMGFNTFNSIGKPLPGRKTIIICSAHKHAELRAWLEFNHPLQVVSVLTIEAFKDKIISHPHDTFVICGGEGLYTAIPPTVVYKTVVDFPVLQEEDVAYAKYTPDLSGYLTLRSDDMVSKTGIAYKVKCFVKQ